MSNGSLKDKTIRGFLWSAIERFGTQGVQFCFSIILARLLVPEDYGIIAMPMIFFALAQIFIDSGFSTALIRKIDLDEEDLSTAFFFNIIVGVACYLLLFFFSPVIATFYKTPILRDILRVSAIVILVNPLAVVQQTVLTKELDFKKQAKISLVSTLFSGLVGLVLALLSFGVWALVFQQVFAAVLRVALLWISSRWYPRAKWSRSSFAYLWNFGSKMLASGVLDTLYNNAFTLVIGKVYSAQSLGHYTRALHFSELPSSNLTGVIQRVSFPVLSTLQENPDALRDKYKKILNVSAFIIFPLMVGLAALAEPLVKVLIGDKWTECIIPLQLLCFARMWYPIHAINLNLLQVKGRSDLFLKLEIIKKIIGVLILVYTVPRGVVYMCAGQIVSSLFALVVNTYYTGKLIRVGFWTQMRSLSPIILLVSTMFGVVHIFCLWMENLYIQLVGGLFLGILFFGGVAKMFKFKETTLIQSLLKKRMNHV